ncbi:MAG: ABC transporter ATP-binding protein [Alicyclobacillus sp.]|nr:ABC transporter ATP-binding protein [Alicyclobacillus sp.]
MGTLSVEAVTYRGILHGVTATLKSGQVVGLIGPNGAGKSTLLRVMAGIWRPDGGRVMLDARNVHTWPSRERARHLTYLPQQLPDDVPYTVTQFVEMGRYAHRGITRGRSIDHVSLVREALERMNLTHLKDIPLSHVSGGERQRAAIARCMAQASQVWLLDEPISNLDLYYQLDILKQLRGLADEGRLILLAIHHLELAAQFCDQLMVLHDGRLTMIGEPTAVLTTDVLANVFRLAVTPYRDPHTGALRFSYV